MALKNWFPKGDKHRRCPGNQATPTKERRSLSQWDVPNWMPPMGIPRRKKVTQYRAVKYIEEETIYVSIHLH